MANLSSLYIGLLIYLLLTCSRTAWLGSKWRVVALVPAFGLTAACITGMAYLRAKYAIAYFAEARYIHFAIPFLWAAWLVGMSACLRYRWSTYYHIGMALAGLLLAGCIAHSAYFLVYFPCL